MSKIRPAENPTTTNLTNPINFIIFTSYLTLNFSCFIKNSTYNFTKIGAFFTILITTAAALVAFIYHCMVAFKIFSVFNSSFLYLSFAKLIILKTVDVLSIFLFTFRIKNFVEIIRLASFLCNEQNVFQSFAGFSLMLPVFLIGFVVAASFCLYEDYVSNEYFKIVIVYQWTVVFYLDVVFVALVLVLSKSLKAFQNSLAENLKDAEFNWNRYVYLTKWGRGFLTSTFISKYKQIIRFTR